MATGGVEIKPGENPGEDGNYVMNFWVEMPDLDPTDPAGLLHYSRNVIVINEDAGTDPATGERTTGIMLQAVGTLADGPGPDVTRISSHGIIASSKGYSVGSIVGYLIKATGIFSTLAAISDVGTIVCGLYARAFNSGTSPEYAIYADGDTFTRGTAIAEGFALSKDNIYHPSNVATQTLPTNYNLFTNKNSTQTQVWLLPLTSGYEQLEELEVSNWNGNEINIKPQTGNTINGYTNTQKRLRLFAPGHCAKLRADKSTNTWIIVSMNGEFTAA